MHKRIKELALQAGGSHYPDVGGKNLEKFAELIVQDCINILSNYKDKVVFMNEDVNPEHPILLIKKHFGMEL